MTIDTKHQVLYALYSEYQKDIPDMDRITSRSLGIDNQAFIVALMKLQNEGYIQGVIWIPPDTMAIQKIRAVKRDNLFMTGKGVKYVEAQAGIEESSPSTEKIKQLGKRLGIFGLDLLKSFILSQIT